MMSFWRYLFGDASPAKVIPPPPSSRKTRKEGEAVYDPPVDPRFPAPNPSLSYWLQHVRNDPLLNHRSTAELPREADVVVIGSGMSGALIAYTLLHSENPPKNVVMLEARETCSGATGRNAGHCKPDTFVKFDAHAKWHGKAMAKEILDNEWQTYSTMMKFILDHKIECDLWMGTTQDVALDQETKEALRATYERYAEYAGGYVRERVRQTLDPGKAKEMSRMNDAQAVWQWPAASFYPWKLVAYLIRAILPLGLNLQTYTPVTSITKSPLSSSSPLWDIHTPRGTITCPLVVHATNAFASTLLPLLSRAITPVPFLCTKSVPPPSYSGSKALRNTYTVHATGGISISINPRPTSDGAVLFGGDGNAQKGFERMIEENPGRRGDDRLGRYGPVEDAVREFTERQFEGWGRDEELAIGEGVDYNWSGVYGQTSDSTSLLGRVPDLPGQFICASFNGHGMAQIFTAAPAVASLVLDPSRSFADTGMPGCTELTRERLEKLMR